jgi:hypothetical protein
MCTTRFSPSDALGVFMVYSPQWSVLHAASEVEVTHMSHDVPAGPTPKRRLSHLAPGITGGCWAAGHFRVSELSNLATRTLPELQLKNEVHTYADRHCHNFNTGIYQNEHLLNIVQNPCTQLSAVLSTCRLSYISLHCFRFGFPACFID